MKKAILVLVVLLCVFAVFAEKNNKLVVNTIPYGIQISTSSKEGQDPVHSYYGIGTEIVYQHLFTKWFFVEGGIGWDTFLMADEDPVPFTNLMYFGGVGYRQVFSDVFSMNFHIDVAGDTLFYDWAVSESITVKTGINCEFAFNKTISVQAGCDGSFGFSKLDGVHYVNYRILPMTGMSITL